MALKKRSESSTLLSRPLLTVVGHPVGLVHQHASELFLLVVERAQLQRGENAERRHGEREREEREGRRKSDWLPFFFLRSFSALKMEGALVALVALALFPYPHSLSPPAFFFLQKEEAPPPAFFSVSQQRAARSPEIRLVVMRAASSAAATNSCSRPASMSPRATTTTTSTCPAPEPLAMRSRRCCCRCFGFR